MHMRAHEKNKRHSLNTQKKAHKQSQCFTFRSARPQSHTLQKGPEQHAVITSADYLKLDAWQFKESISVLRSVYTLQLSDVMSQSKRPDTMNQVFFFKSSLKMCCSWKSVFLFDFYWNNRQCLTWISHINRSFVVSLVLKIQVE